jgi:hypothetical protein
MWNQGNGDGQAGGRDAHEVARVAAGQGAVDCERVALADDAVDADRQAGERCVRLPPLARARRRGAGPVTAGTRRRTRRVQGTEGIASAQISQVRVTGVGPPRERLPARTDTWLTEGRAVADSGVTSSTNRVDICWLG